MWLSKQMRPEAAASGADLDLPVYGPGGYLWTPANGSAVLVVKGGPGGEEQCVAGARPAEDPADIRPGEVYIYGPGGNAVYLRQDGGVEIRGERVSITGKLTVNGQAWAPGETEKEE